MLKLLGINNARMILVKDVEGSLDVLNFLDRNGHGGVIFGTPWLLFRGLRLSRLGSRFGTHQNI